MEIHISTQSEKVIREHAVQAFPNECCGFLYGTDGGDIRWVSFARPVPNSREGDQARNFEIAAQDYLEAEKFAIREGLDLLGIYHSHPLHPAIPSAHDLRQAVPYFSYLIISVSGQESGLVTSWQLDEAGSFREEGLFFEPASQVETNIKS